MSKGRQILDTFSDTTDVTGLDNFLNTLKKSDIKFIQDMILKKDYSLDTKNEREKDIFEQLSQLKDEYNFNGDKEFYDIVLLCINNMNSEELYQEVEKIRTGFDIIYGLEGDSFSEGEVAKFKTLFEN